MDKSITVKSMKGYQEVLGYVADRLGRDSIKKVELTVQGFSENPLPCYQMFDEWAWLYTKEHGVITLRYNDMQYGLYFYISNYGREGEDRTEFIMPDFGKSDEILKLLEDKDEED